MNVSAHIEVDKATYFRFVASQAEGRFEYDRGRVLQQTTGGTLAHSIIAQRFISAFERRLDTSIWVVTGHSRGVETPATVRYPDVLVEPMSGAIMSGAMKGLTTEVPAAIVEVLSPLSGHGPSGGGQLRTPAALAADSALRGVPWTAS